MITSEDVVIGISYSGSSKELLITVALALSTIPVFELGKAIQRASLRKKQA